MRLLRSVWAIAQNPNVRPAPLSGVGKVVFVLLFLANLMMLEMERKAKRGWRKCCDALDEFTITLQHIRCSMSGCGNVLDLDSAQCAKCLQDQLETFQESDKPLSPL